MPREARIAVPRLPTAAWPPLLPPRAGGETGGDDAADGAAGKRGVRRGRTFTQQQRQAALEVHRVHALCLLAHALAHDVAAADTALQAVLLSMLPEELLLLAAAAATSEDAAAAQGCLPRLLRWFHRCFSAERWQQLPPPHAPGAGAQGEAAAAAAAAAGPSSSSGSSSSRRRRRGRHRAGAGAQGWRQEMLGLGRTGASVQQQLQDCVSSCSGSSTQLAVLLVALLRSLGFLTRSVW
jgi:hypothetical protein